MLMLSLNFLVAISFKGLVFFISVVVKFWIVWFINFTLFAEICQLIYKYVKYRFQVIYFKSIKKIDLNFLILYHYTNFII